MGVGEALAHLPPQVEHPLDGRRGFRERSTCAEVHPRHELRDHEGWPSCSPTSRTPAMFGCWRAEAACASRSSLEIGRASVRDLREDLHRRRAADPGCSRRRRHAGHAAAQLAPDLERAERFGASETSSRGRFYPLRGGSACYRPARGRRGSWSSASASTWWRPRGWRRSRALGRPVPGEDHGPGGVRARARGPGAGRSRWPWPSPARRPRARRWARAGARGVRWRDVVVDLADPALRCGWRARGRVRATASDRAGAPGSALEMAGSWRWASSGCLT